MTYQWQHMPASEHFLLSQKNSLAMQQMHAAQPDSKPLLLLLHISSMHDCVASLKYYTSSKLSVRLTAHHQANTSARNILHMVKEMNATSRCAGNVQAGAAIYRIPHSINETHVRIGSPACTVALLRYVESESSTSCCCIRCAPDVWSPCSAFIVFRQANLAEVEESCQHAVNDRALHKQCNATMQMFSMTLHPQGTGHGTRGSLTKQSYLLTKHEYGQWACCIITS